MKLTAKSWPSCNNTPFPNALKHQTPHRCHAALNEWTRWGCWTLRSIPRRRRHKNGSHRPLTEVKDLWTRRRRRWRISEWEEEEDETIEPLFDLRYRLLSHLLPVCFLRQKQCKQLKMVMYYQILIYDTIIVYSNTYLTLKMSLKFFYKQRASNLIWRKRLKKRKRLTMAREFD